jgi:RNA polymerase sigma-70 factor (sigma-E family)
VNGKPGAPSPPDAPSDEIAVSPRRDHRRGAVPEPFDFDAFVAHRSERLLRAGYLLTRDWGLAEDLVQVTLAKVWRHWRRIDDPDAYVWTTMTRTYQSWWRRKWRGEVPTEALPDSPAASVDADGRADLWAAMAQLSRQQRAVLVLRYFVDLTESETAEILGCTVGTVKTHTSRALARLRLDPGLAGGADREREPS